METVKSDTRGPCVVQGAERGSAEPGQTGRPGCGQAGATLQARIRSTRLIPQESQRSFIGTYNKRVRTINFFEKYTRIVEVGKRCRHESHFTILNLSIL